MPLSSNTWYYVVAWHDSVGNQVGISVNDSVPDTAAFTFGSFDDVGTFAIGKESVNYFGGTIDEVGFWKRTLTSGERTQLYNAGAGLAYPFTSSARPSSLQLLGMG